jgi:hypothetical protein
MMAVNQALVRLRPTLFGFQILLVVEPRPTLATLLEAAQTTAAQNVIAIDRQRLRESA